MTDHETFSQSSGIGQESDIGTDRDSPIQTQPVSEIFNSAAAQFPARPCIDFLGHGYSYKQVSSQVNCAAEGFRCLGVREGVKGRCQGWLVFVKHALLCVVHAQQRTPATYMTALQKPPSSAFQTPIGAKCQKAFVKLRDGCGDTTSERLKAHLKTKLSMLEMPRDIEIRDKLPKTMIGKLSKTELRKTPAK